MYIEVLYCTVPQSACSGFEAYRTPLPRPRSVPFTYSTSQAKPSQACARKLRVSLEHSIPIITSLQTHHGKNDLCHAISIEAKLHNLGQTKEGCKKTHGQKGTSKLSFLPYCAGPTRLTICTERTSGKVISLSLLQPREFCIGGDRQERWCG